VDLPDGADGEMIDLVLEYLVSKNLGATAQALQAEISRCTSQSSPGADCKWHSRWTSRLESYVEGRLVDVHMQRSAPCAASDADLRPGGDTDDSVSKAFLDFGKLVDATPAASRDFMELSYPAVRSRRIKRFAKDQESSEVAPRKPKLFDMVKVSDGNANQLRLHRGTGTPLSRVIFHESVASPRADDERVLGHIALPIIFDIEMSGLEDESELALTEGLTLAKRYRIEQFIGKGAFSKVVQCHDVQCNQKVSVKAMRNNKECIDSGLAEVRVLAWLAKLDPEGHQPIIRLHDYFYTKEHLLIVTELCGDTLNAFSRLLDKEGRRSLYFTPECLASLSKQMCTALTFMHENGIVHTDLKTDNVCVVSSTRHIFKLIDLGSSIMRKDIRNSYVQSRPYRAPEVMLGMEWDGKVDLWSLGAMLLELVVGAPIFFAPSVAQVLASIVAVAGPIPPAMLRVCTSTGLSSIFFTPKGELYEVDPPTFQGVVILQPKSNVSIAHLLKDTDSMPLVDFTSSLLTMDPTKRIGAADALKHPFISSVETQTRPSSTSRRVTFTVGSMLQKVTGLKLL
jgi:serine/threonine protein kinase